LKKNPGGVCLGNTKNARFAIFALQKAKLQEVV
jgi:hypothetical protein